MTSKQFSVLVGRLLRCPAAPYHESAVRSVVERMCLEHGLPHTRDAFGNVLVRWRTDAKLRPLVLAAHLDHPGFDLVRPLSRGRWHARFLGGVPSHFFRAGVPVRLMPGEFPARLGRRLPGGKAEFELLTTPSQRARSLDSAEPRFAVWDLEDFAVRRGRIHGRACDDLIGVASILATLIDLKQQRERVHVLGVISRAEEVGFHGALTAAASKSLPRNSLLVSLETSKELPAGKMGSGVIIRVGDRTSIFDSAGTRFLTDVAAGMEGGDSSFQFQRALMSGGTCEATAYQEFGFQTAAVCIALGNYHNCGPRDRIAAEYVDLADACGMVRLLVAAAQRMRSFGPLTRRLPTRLHAMLREARRELRSR
jgi:putative aminopeptidase FrvX